MKRMLVVENEDKEQYLEEMGYTCYTHERIVGEVEGQYSSMNCSVAEPLQIGDIVFLGRSANFIITELWEY